MTYLLNAALKQGMVEIQWSPPSRWGPQLLVCPVAWCLIATSSSAFWTGSTSLSFRMSGEQSSLQRHFERESNGLYGMANQKRRWVSSKSNDECRRLKQERETCRFIWLSQPKSSLVNYQEQATQHKTYTSQVAESHINQLSTPDTQKVGNAMDSGGST